MFKYCIVILTIFANVIDFVYERPSTGSSIRCYECNSANNSMCLDPTMYDVESVQKYLRLTTCEKSLLPQPKSGQMFCRKIVQTILHKGHDAEVRVTRGCGWVRHHKACYKADNDDHLETVCQCFSDDCNSASAVEYSIVAAVAAIGSVFVLH